MMEITAGRVGRAGQVGGRVGEADRAGGSSGRVGRAGPAGLFLKVNVPASLVLVKILQGLKLYQGAYEVISL